ncbi:MAG: hypothetical protein ACXVZ2_00450 [Gaiellaceae bacterium]
MRRFRRRKQISELARLLVALEALSAERRPLSQRRSHVTRLSVGR